jgi:SAM-dependent methyltransferase
MMDAPGYEIDASNAEQATDWDGDSGAYWAQFHTEYERLLGVFDARLLEAGEVGAADHCLDIGCGTGATSLALAARAVDGSVLGLDLSGPMLAVARDAAREAGADQVTFVQGDAQVHAFEPASVDVAVSRMGCMFFGDPAAAFANIGRALRPGGRLALSVWRDMAANEWVTAIDGALAEAPDPDQSAPEEPQPRTYEPGPFSMGDSAVCTTALRDAGYVDITVEPVDVPLSFGTVEAAQAFLGTWIDDERDPAGRAAAVESLRELLVGSSRDGVVLLPSATWLVTARRPAAAAG